MLVKLAWRNIGRGWRRSAIVLVAIAIGLAACVFLLAWSKGMIHQMADNAIRTQLAHLAVQARGYQSNPDVARNLAAPYREIAALVDARPGAHASPRLRGEGLVQSARRSLRVAVVGVLPRAEAAVSIVPGALIEGEFLTEPGARRRSRLPPVVIGRSMAERLRVGLGDKVVLHVPGEAGLGAFRVRGLYRTASSEFDRSVAFLRLPDAQRLFDLPDHVTEVAIALDRPSELPAVQGWLRSAEVRTLAAQPIEVLSWQEREPRLAALLGVAAEVSWIFYGAVFLAMAFGIANALLMAVYERMREFGVLRSLGLRPRRLVTLVLLESLLLTLAGTALGLAIGFVLVLWLGQVGIDLRVFSLALQEYGVGTTIYLRADVYDVVGPTLLATATALLAALWPALKAARLRPAEALRQT